MSMLVLQGASGKLGFATLSALLEHNLIPASEITVTTSSSSGAFKLQPFVDQGVKLAHVSWDSPVSEWVSVLQGASALFLISSARIDKDFHFAEPGKGRESDHYVALEAAKQAGVEHVYYTSLAFANPSQSRVMKAHERTEEVLQCEWAGKFTSIREGLYNESWPLYFGHYDFQNNDRTEVVTAGDGKISWTSIPDLGLANALILADPISQWAGKTLYLSQKQAHTLSEVAEMVSRAKGKEVKFRTVSREEHEKFYTQERGLPAPMIEWWSRTYDALKDGECEIEDPTLEKLLARKGVKAKGMEETVREMLKAP
jgi:uncharacterized protein YbjT (DUF2867 family)